MSFTKNMPQPNDFLSNSQGQFLANNQVLVDSLAIDHVSIEDGTPTERLKHTALHLKEQAIDPTTTADEGGLFVKQVAGQDDLYYRHENNGAVVKLTSGGTTGGNILAWCYAANTGPNTYTVSYGSNIASVIWDGSPTSNYTVNFNVALLSANYIVQVLEANASSQNISFISGSFSTTSFKLNNPPPDTTDLCITVIG